MLHVKMNDDFTKTFNVDGVRQRISHDSDVWETAEAVKRLPDAVEVLSDAYSIHPEIANWYIKNL